jgi:hypothetical protein
VFPKALAVSTTKGFKRIAQPLTDALGKNRPPATGPSGSGTITNTSKPRIRSNPVKMELPEVSH